jgi:hypothetical protein
MLLSHVFGTYKENNQEPHRMPMANSLIWTPSLRNDGSHKNELTGT